MASETGSRYSSAADSYIGSLISLTSKIEIRYEGVLYNINTIESTIELINARSFGTEGRKKDGPQIPPIDKIFEHIFFQRSEIKDIRVKSSPPVQPAPTINNYPAVIQSHYSRPVYSSPSLPYSISGCLININSHTAQLGLPGSNVQGGLHLYQSRGVLGSWPNANGNGLAIPMYWQGYYAQQPPLLGLPPGMSIPSPMQQPMYYPGFKETNTVSTFPYGPYQVVSQPLSSVVGTSSFISADTPAPSLFSPGQLLQSALTSSKFAQKNVELFQVSSSPSEVSMPVSTQLQPITEFTEEFDYMAMYEKFNKDEVWGDLGKSNKSHEQDKQGYGRISDDENDAKIPKPVYSTDDDLFDTLYSNAFHQESQNGRTRYSEQMKMHRETFGEFARLRGRRGRRGSSRGGRSRGGYYGMGGI